MNSKIELSQKINYVLTHCDMPVEVKQLLLNIKDELNKDLNSDEKFDLWIKLISIFKDVAIVATNIIKGPE
ncbi:hypothetical protein [Chryseobacterium daeguense]|uniref:hypothetical protein n=1 Tax=Chryseobacterium daeguense TaxID=412438 RepID=UPI0012DCF710|nr:hypothetical protein [Chryseobacterium daeguense]